MLIIKNKNIIYILISIVFSTIILFFTSATSPIRDINFINYDSTIFYLIGKGIKYGYTPYIDLIDHKGIYIFLINYFATLISETNHLGLFIIHLLISYFAIFTLYKISYLLTKRAFVSIFSSIIIVVIQNLYPFSHGAIKCETFLAPFLYLALYLFLVGSWGKTFSLNMFFIGICAGVVIFTKANIVLCFLPIAFYLIYINIKEKKYFNIFRLFLSGITGVIIAFIPGIVYCISNNCLREMIQYNFINNIIYSKDLFYIYNSYSDAVIEVIDYFKILIILSVISIIPFYKLTHSKQLFSFYILYIIFNNIASFMALRPFSYYANPLLNNILFTIIYIFLIFDQYLISKKKGFVLLYIPILISSFILSYNFAWKATERINIRNYHFAKQIKEYVGKSPISASNNKKSQLLVIGATLNVYNELDELPPIKNFCIPYMSNKINVKSYDEITENLSTKSSKYVVLSFTELMVKNGSLKDIRKILDENYNLVLEYRGGELYCRKE